MSSPLDSHRFTMAQNDSIFGKTCITLLLHPSIFERRNGLEYEDNISRERERDINRTVRSGCSISMGCFEVF